MDPDKKTPIKKIFPEFTFENIFIALLILLGIVLITNIILTSNINKDLKTKIEVIKESSRPAKIELTLIQNSKCADCFEISTIISNLKNANVDVVEEKTFEFDSEEGKEIIRKYEIEKVPTVVITGEIDKLDIQWLEKKENALVLSEVEPPYTNVMSGEIEGLVTLYILKDSECTSCNDLAFLISQVKNAGVTISEEKTIASNTDEGKELIGKYNIRFVPSIILSKDAEVYDVIQKAWANIGSKENDGSYVLRLVYPPFINLTTGKLRGIVNIIYLTDKSCTDCYDVNKHKETLTNPQSFAIRFDKEETIDISDAKGKELLDSYNITQVPTIILSDEISVYPSTQALKQFFSIEKDGSYVFRKASVVGTYKDLATNQVIKIQQQAQE